MGVICIFRMFTIARTRVTFTIIMIVNKPAIQCPCIFLVIPCNRIPSIIIQIAIIAFANESRCSNRIIEIRVVYIQIRFLIVNGFLYKCLSLCFIFNRCPSQLKSQSPIRRCIIIIFKIKIIPIPIPVSPIYTSIIEVDCHIAFFSPWLL